MISEKLPTEPSMDEILASIRKIISADSQDKTNEIRPEANSFFASHESEDILDLTDALPEEVEKNQEPTILSEFSLNEIGEWAPPANQDVYLGETTEKSQDRGSQTSSYISTPPSSFEDSLLSRNTMSETMQAFHILNSLEQEKSKSSEPYTQEEMGGQTIENLMREMLKPLLKEWLNTHLPSLVRSVVTEQVEKIVRQTKS